MKDVRDLKDFTIQTSKWPSAAAKWMARERGRERKRQRERGGIETSDYEPFALHAPIQWAM